MRSAGLLAFVFVALVGCGGDTSGPSNGNNTGSDFDVSIGAGTKPTYSWPGGNAFSVSIVRVSAPGTIVWGIANPTMIITSPVTHGTIPAGALESASSEKTLTAGVKYRISVTRADQKTGFKEFTP